MIPKICISNVCRHPWLIGGMQFHRFQQEKLSMASEVFDVNAPPRSDFGYLHTKLGESPTGKKLRAPIKESNDIDVYELALIN